MNRTQMNKEARNKIAEIAEEKCLDRCEFLLVNDVRCGSTFGVAPAHRYRRTHYSSAKELSDFNEWIVLCQPHHQEMDDRSLTTEEEKEDIFKKLRT